ncbi:MAG: hypothetical protein Q8935_13815 [Bacillota bacterium]|jgi:hypothetical protein|nr:hypothetical protein [Bacillota bacterium]
MENYSNDNTARRYAAHVSILGTTQLHLRNPYIIAWWSAAFPGFGHWLLSKHLRGFVLFGWEVIVNMNAHINLAMLYSFQGKIELAKDVLNTRWLLIYIPVYIFAIWDSYRTTVDINKISILANHENHRMNTFSLGAMEINYLDRRKPSLAIIWSLFVPGLGQLYLHRIITAFFIIIWVMIFAFYSRGLEAISLLFLGEIQKATAVLNSEWLLFFPSIYGFAVFDAYENTIENNKLFKKEQNTFLMKNYQSPHFRVKKGTKVE